MAGSPIKHERNRLVRAAILRSIQTGEDPVDALIPFATKLKDMALAGDIAAIKEMFDRVDGKPAQQVQIGGDGSGDPVIVEVVRFADKS